MRGQWAEASEECTRVLERAPGNATAHSLLGDLYLDQGRVEEARHWYQLAIEFNPQSEADRARLARAEELLEARRQRAQWEAVIQGRSQPVSTHLLVRESVQRILAIAGLSVCGIILALATVLSLSERHTSAQDPAVGIRTLSSGRRAVLLTPDTVREQELLRRLSPLAGGRGLLLQRLELDPPPDTVQVRLYAPWPVRARQSIREFRALVLREAYRCAFHLRAFDSALERVRIVVVGPGEPDGPADAKEFLFVGVLRTGNLVVDADRATPTELAAALDGTEPPVWAQELSVP